jgi:hypothetical protein
MAWFMALSVIFALAQFYGWLLGQGQTVGLLTFVVVSVVVLVVLPQQNGMMAKVGCCGGGGLLHTMRLRYALCAVCWPLLT